MNEQQVKKALILLAELYADQLGMNTPKVEIRRTKDEGSI